MSNLHYKASAIFIVFEIVLLALLSAYFHTWLIVAFGSALLFPMLIVLTIKRFKVIKT